MITSKRLHNLMRYFKRQGTHSWGSLWVPDSDKLAHTPSPGQFSPPELPVAVQTTQEWDDHEPVWYWANQGAMTRGQTYQHIHATGGSGRGKSSGLIQHVAKYLLGSSAWTGAAGAGYGAFITTVKPGDPEKYKQWILECTGTLDHVIEITLDEECLFTINPFDYLTSLSDNVQVENLIELFSALGDVTGEGESSRSTNADPIWRKSMQALLRNIFTILIHAREPLTWQNLSNFLRSLPQNPETAKSESWQQNSYANHLINRAVDLTEDNPGALRVVGHAASYFFIEVPSRSEKTMASVVMEFSAIADLFIMNGALHHLFGTTTSWVPELCFEGAVILASMPVLGPGGEAAKYAQTILKQLFSKAALRRDVSKYPRSLLLLSDENQILLNQQDATTNQLAREMRLSVIACTQALPNYYAALGGSQSHDAVDSYLSNFQTHLWFGNSCKTTNSWAADSVSKLEIERSNKTTFFGEGQDEDSEGQGYRATTGSSSQSDYARGATPRDFTLLKCRDGFAECILWQGGEVVYPDGQTHLKIRFDQNCPITSPAEKRSR